MKEVTENRLPYPKISNKVIIEALDRLKPQNLDELGVPDGVIFMIRQGYAKQLRSDVFEILSKALNCDISAKLK